jgi:GDP-6-deoxy-D-talose 4-dehydrogenase
VNRTLVTGVGGFTGPYLARLLADRGHEVHGLVQPGRTPVPVPGVSQMHGADLTDLAATRVVIAAVRPTHVVHLAGIAFVAHGDVAEMYRSNILGTRYLLQALADAPEAPVSILLASSANVYGNAREGILDEADPLAPSNDYGVTKVGLEFVARLYAKRLPIVVARPFNYTGRGQSPAFLIPKIVAHLAARAPTIELGNLDVARDFSDVRTIVDAYARLLEAPAAIEGTFNICSGVARSLDDVVTLAQSIAGHRLDVRVNPAFVRSDEVRRLAGSPARVEACIGPLARIPLDDTLRWMLEA